MPEHQIVLERRQQILSLNQVPVMHRPPSYLHQIYRIRQNNNFSQPVIVLLQHQKIPCIDSFSRTCNNLLCKIQNGDIIVFKKTWISILDPQPPNQITETRKLKWEITVNNPKITGFLLFTFSTFPVNN